MVRPGRRTTRRAPPAPSKTPLVPVAMVLRAIRDLPTVVYAVPPDGKVFSTQGMTLAQRARHFVRDLMPLAPPDVDMEGMKGCIVSFLLIELALSGVPQAHQHPTAVALAALAVDEALRRELRVGIQVKLPLPGTFREREARAA